MICLYKERDIFKNGFTNVLNFAFTNVVYLVRKLNDRRNTMAAGNRMVKRAVGIQIEFHSTNVQLQKE